MWVDTIHMAWVSLTTCPKWARSTLFLSSQMKLSVGLASGRMLPTRLETQVAFPGDDPICGPRLSSQARPGSVRFSEEVKIKVTSSVV